jgi:phosphoribosyl 1,2-cyclic phosphodiesterase
MPMLRIELPAAQGDAVWIEYGDPQRPHRIVIDGGPAISYERALRQRILALRPAERRIDLLIVTHIDCDHIDGSIILVRELKGPRRQNR